jgi:hypothetical protein
MEEAFYVLEGGGILTLNDDRHPFEKGATIFIPGTRGTGLKTPIANCCCHGLFRQLGWTASSARLAAHSVRRQSN